MLRNVLIPMLAVLASACATTGGPDNVAMHPAPQVADHPDARLAIAIAAELEARSVTGAGLSQARPEMEALAAALWSRDIAGSDAANEPEPEEVIPPGTSLLYGVHIASYRSLDHAGQGWATMLGAMPDILTGLEPRVEEADLGERGIYLRLKAGPFLSPDEAQTACRSLTERAIYCQVMPFTGRPLAPDAED